MHNIYIGGAGGVGKTTVGRLVETMLPSSTFYDGSDVFRRATGVVPSESRAIRDADRRSNDEYLGRLLRANQRVILAGHFLLSPELVHLFDFACVLIAPQAVLIERRLEDTSRARATGALEVLNDCDETLARLCAMLAASSRCCFAVPAIDDARTVAARIAALARAMDAGALAG